jgi:hypothetical protein
MTTVAVILWLFTRLLKNRYANYESQFIFFTVYSYVLIQHLQGQLQKQYSVDTVSTM